MKNRAAGLGDGPGDGAEMVHKLIYGLELHRYIGDRGVRDPVPWVAHMVWPLLSDFPVHVIVDPAPATKLPNRYGASSTH